MVEVCPHPRTPPEPNGMRTGVLERILLPCVALPHPNPRSHVHVYVLSSHGRMHKGVLDRIFDTADTNHDGRVSFQVT
jgi:hypothetical protein